MYGRIVEDLITIEREVIEISPKTYVRGSVAFASTENLGGHALGGLVENFSTTQYLCRYCLITRNEFWPQSAGENNTCNEEENEESDVDPVTEVDVESETEVDSEADLESESDVDSEAILDSEAVVEYDMDEVFEMLHESEEDEESGESDANEEDASQLVFDNYVPLSYERGTEESYKQSLANKGNKKYYRGIKFDSVFNKLEGFQMFVSLGYHLVLSTICWMVLERSICIL